VDSLAGARGSSRGQEMATNKAVVTKYAAATNYAGAVGEILKTRRRLVGLTQVGLSEKAGVKQSIISLVENGRRTYSLDALARVADALGTKLSTIMKEAEKITYERTKEQSANVISQLKRR